MTDIEILQILTKAKELGVTMEDVQAYKNQQIQKVPDKKPEEIVSPMSILDEYSDEEILFYATPYFEEIQYKKEMQKQKLSIENEND